jgi:aldehyde:ferredoxin oxidoreductase
LAGGFIGKILRVDLTLGKVHEETLGESFFKSWLGGYGLGARIVYSDIAQKTDPLGPGNILGFAAGLLTGTLTPLGSGFTVVGKSPLTGTWGDSRAGGFFGPELKFAGFDAVFFFGRSSKPVYLWINDGKAVIKDASDLWGRDTFETEDVLREQHGDKRVQVASIGPAGEKFSLVSCIITDKGRAAGRSGLGSVAGSKNLKAVAVRGTMKIPIEDREKLTELRTGFITIAKEERGAYWDYFTRYGTSGSTEMLSLTGDSPCKNWAGAGSMDFPTAAKISDESILKYQTRKYACHGCPMACGGHVRVETGSDVIEGMKPEYETLAAFGTLCLNDDLESIMLANDICNRYGLDTISTGSIIAFAIECYENNLITKEDTGGIELTWGNSAAIVKMTEDIARRGGFGATLADGVKIAADKIGRGAEKYALHVAGQELPMHDPKLTPAYGNIYVVDATPGRHTQGYAIYLDELSGVEMPPFGDEHDYRGKGAANAYMSYFNHVVNALGVCQFPSNLIAIEGIPSHADFVNAVTGWDTTMSALLVCGERIACIRQAFNVREGFTPMDFKLPGRASGKPSLPEGPLKGVTIEIENWVREYYQYADWDYTTGLPSLEKLIQLGLAEVAKDFYEEASLRQMKLYKNEGL